MLTRWNVITITWNHALGRTQKSDTPKSLCKFWPSSILLNTSIKALETLFSI